MMKNRKKESDIFFDIGMNVVLLTLDSCRFDSFFLAKTPFFDSLGVFRQAYSQGTYTYPSHLSMFSGVFPDLRENIDFYNRFSKGIFKIKPSNGFAVEVQSQDALYLFKEGTNTIIEGFADIGYNTLGLGAMGWFHHPNLSSPFQNFVFTGIHLSEQIDCMKRFIKQDKAPFFIFCNIGETHEPYQAGGLVTPSFEVTRYRSRLNGELTWKEKEMFKDQHNRQIRCVEYIDALLGDFICSVQNALIIITADHGECFGEDGLFGHGFYHPKVMEVPLGIFNV